MFSPTENANRIAELENTVRRLEAALEGSRRAGAETVISPQIRTARTALREVTDETTDYPRDWYVAAIPIVFTDWELTEADDEHYADELEIGARSRYAVTHARSPIWLPPLVDVEVALLDGVWRIVRWPALLLGKIGVAGVAAAEWNSEDGDNCASLTPGRAQVHIYRLEKDTWDYVPQYYDEEQTDAVRLWVANTCGVVAGNKLLTLAPDADGEWHVVIEPCALTCSS